ALRQALPAPGLAHDAAETTILVRLPSQANAPQPSRPFLYEGAAQGQPALAAWTVPALAFDPADAPGMLAGLPAEDDTTPGVDLGADLRFWQDAARLALHLLAGQRFVPAIVEERGRLLGRWRPALDAPEDQAGFERLARAMPPASRALARDED